jgi:hypothetical protein
VFLVNNNRLGSESQYAFFNQLEEGVRAKIYCVFFCPVWVQSLGRADTRSIAPYQIKSIAIKS